MIKNAQSVQLLPVDFYINSTITQPSGYVGPQIRAKYTHTHTHTYTFNGPLSGTTRMSWYQKGKNQSGFYRSKRQ